jgi:hypothetical protein
MSTATRVIVIGIAAITACVSYQVRGAATTEGPTLAAPKAAMSVYVVQDTVNDTSILQFAATSNGNATPISTLTLPAGGPSSVAMDSSGSIYVGAATDNSISVYPAGSSGADSPRRTILGSDKSFSYPYLMTVDSHNSLYVSDGAPCACVAVFSNSNDDETSPQRMIKGDRTQMNEPIAFAVDGSGYLYVASLGLGPLRDEGQIEVFAPDATGNVAPLRVITGTKSAPLSPSGIAVDAKGNVYINQGMQILEYASGASDNAAPIRTIVPPAADVISSHLHVDGVGNVYVLVLQQINGSIMSKIAKYPATATGRAVPESTFSSTTWTKTGFGFALK